MTYLEDFKNKFPNSHYEDEEIIEEYCVSQLYGTNFLFDDDVDDDEIYDNDEVRCNGINCTTCWKQMIKE